MVIGTRSPRLVLITRPVDDAVKLSAKLAAIGMHSVIDPMLRVQPVPVDHSNKQHQFASACIITSKHAVFALRKFLIPTHIPVFVTAPNTAELIKQQGYHNIIVGDDCAASLVPKIVRYLTYSQSPIIYFCGRDVRYDFQTSLSKFRFDVHKITVYEAVPAMSLQQKTVLAWQQNHIAAVLFYSPKTVQTFCHLLIQTNCRMDQVIAVCLSQDIAKTVSLPFAKIIAADHPNDDMMIKALQRENMHE